MTDTDDRVYPPGTLREGYHQLVCDHLPGLDPATQNAIIAALDDLPYFTPTKAPRPEHLANNPSLTSANWYAIRDSELKALTSLASLVAFFVAAGPVVVAAVAPAAVATAAAVAPAAVVGTISGLVLAWHNYRTLRISLTEDQFNLLEALRKTKTTGATPDELAAGPAFSAEEAIAVLETLKDVRRKNNTRLALVDFDTRDGRWRAVDV